VPDWCSEQAGRHIASLGFDKFNPCLEFLTLRNDLLQVEVVYEVGCSAAFGIGFTISLKKMLEVSIAESFRGFEGIRVSLGLWCSQKLVYAVDIIKEPRFNLLCGFHEIEAQDTGHIFFADILLNLQHVQAGDFSVTRLSVEAAVDSNSLISVAPAIAANRVDNFGVNVEKPLKVFYGGSAVGKIKGFDSTKENLIRCTFYKEK